LGNYVLLNYFFPFQFGELPAHHCEEQGEDASGQPGGGQGQWVGEGCLHLDIFN
jgi:hypothetical protein